MIFISASKAKKRAYKEFKKSVLRKIKISLWLGGTSVTIDTANIDMEFQLDLERLLERKKYTIERSVFPDQLSISWDI